MGIKEAFDRFSRRRTSNRNEDHEVPPETRSRVLTYCADHFRGHHEEFWAAIGELLHLRHPLEFKWDRFEPIMGPLRFLSECPGDRFLDFVEDVFRVNVSSGVRYHGQENRMVDSINEIFDIQGLPYQLTRYHETLGEKGPFGGREVIATFPKIILRESDVLHSEAVQPALSLLQEPGLESANVEYIKAHSHYLKGEYRDAIMMSSTALESVLKVIFHQKGWPYDQKDTAAKLIDGFVAKTSLDGFFKAGLLFGPQLRNAQSFSHGAGVQKKTGSKHMAQLALNLTAAAILFLVEEARTI